MAATEKTKGASGSMGQIYSLGERLRRPAGRSPTRAIGIARIMVRGSPDRSRTEVVMTNPEKDATAAESLQGWRAAEQSAAVARRGKVAAEAAAAAATEALEAAQATAEAATAALAAAGLAEASATKTARAAKAVALASVAGLSDADAQSALADVDELLARQAYQDAVTRAEAKPNAGR